MITFRLFCLVGSLALLVGCGANGKKGSLVKECKLPGDQSGTLNGHWSVVPIPVSFVQGEFSDEMMASGQRAGKTWNDFFKSTRGKVVLNLGPDGSPNQTTSTPNTDSCGASLLSPSGEFIDSVKIDALAAWNKPSTAIAVTTFCTISGSGDSNVPEFKSASVSVNFQNYFIAGKQQPDFQTIMLHELGHVLGLGHSCESPAQDGIPDCSSGLKSDYFRALMFPTFSFPNGVQGEQKRDLRSNDQGRANCLY